MKKILFISLAVVLALSVGLIGCDGGPVAPESIKIGLARDLDGPLSVFECGYGGAVYRWFADKVNDDGGVYLSEYDADVPIELIVRDFAVIGWDLGPVTEGLIDDGVDFIWGGPGTDCIFTQAQICNAEGILLLTLEGGASSMIEGAPGSKQIDGWPYVWVSLSFSNWYQIPVLYDMLVAEVGPDPTVYMTYIGGAGATHGLEYSQVTTAEFGAPNVVDAGFHAYELDATAASAIITAAHAAYNSTPYDIFCAYTYPGNVFALTGALIGSTFDPPAILFGPGGNANIYPFLFGNYTNEVMSFIVADNSTSTEVSNMYTELAAQVVDDWGDGTIPCNPLPNGWIGLDYWGQPCYVAALEMWAQAVEDAGNLDSADVRNELASLNMTTVLGANTYFTVFGDGYGGGILAHETHPGEIGQWISGEYRIVGGNDPTETFVYPNTGDWLWLLD